MTTENTEQRLTEIHNRVELSKPIDVIGGSYTYYYLKDVPWLLELVDGGHWEQVLKLREETWVLRERVLELEQHFSNEANLEHMPTSGDLV